ncbi:TPA: hypothetical protein RZK36_001796, partial [Campylobacter coli]|nr:hypothetical protein [Campylobacter coli]
MGFWDTVGGFISGCASVIGSACKAIGGAIMDGIGKLAGAILPHIGTLSNIL